MQPTQAEAVGIETRRSRLDADRFAVSSRRRALDRLREAFGGGPDGPVLITGEPGTGKSWLVRRLVEGLPAGWRTVEVEMTSALDGQELLRLAGGGLGLAMPDRLGAARLTLAAGLREAAADGRKWLLIVDEAQRAMADASEEIQAVSHQLGRPGGFAALILMGRTEMARDLAAPRRDGWASRLALHIHLRPLDLDEARDLPGLPGRLAELDLEVLHRDALGNPRAMLRMAEERARVLRPATAEAAPLAAVRKLASSRPARALPGGESRGFERPGGSISPDGAGTAAPVEAAAAPRLASLIPARPPLRLEDGLVEVGWEGDLEAEPMLSDAPTPEPGPEPTDAADPGEELVEDRYAALQAWAEWSRNRERPSVSAVDPASGRGEHSRDPSHDAGPSDEPPRGDAGITPPPSVRSETPHDYAPFGQLFGRLRHSM